jgi:hypothetical protein
VVCPEQIEAKLESKHGVRCQEAREVRHHETPGATVRLERRLPAAAGAEKRRKAW